MNEDNPSTPDSYPEETSAQYTKPDEPGTEPEMGGGNPPHPVEDVYHENTEVSTSSSQENTNHTPSSYPEDTSAQYTKTEETTPASYPDDASAQYTKPELTGSGATNVTVPTKEEGLARTGKENLDVLAAAGITLAGLGVIATKAAKRMFHRSK